MKTVIYHNPRCSKSRQTLQLLNDNNISTEIVEYLKTPLDNKQIKKLLNLLKLDIRSIIRSNEQAYKDNNLANQDLSEQEIINIVVKNPILLERPIVIYNNKAVICRPPELVLGLIK